MVGGKDATAVVMSLELTNYLASRLNELPVAVSREWTLGFCSCRIYGG